MKSKIFLSLGFCLSFVILFVGCQNKINPITSDVEQSVEFITTTLQQEPIISEITDPDFRNVKWGMTKEEVKESETDITLADESETLLLYETVVLNNHVYAGYSFENNKLYRGSYMLRETHSNKNLFYNDYKIFVKGYTEKYGEPIDSREFWLNSLYKNDPDSIGMAISAGHVLFSTKWKTETTEITIILNGDNYICRLMVIYDSLEIVPEKNMSGV